MSELISENYIKLNNQLHVLKGTYGCSTVKYKNIILELINKYNFTSVIDYGCGKQTAKTFLPENIKYIPYDPAFPELNILPEPNEFLICTDVLEHIEPEFLENVLKKINDITLNICFLTIALRPAKKILSDGRNAHLIVKRKEFWIDKINNNFNNFKIINEEYKVNDYLNLIIQKQL
jgi:hypothetical protein